LPSEVRYIDQQFPSRFGMTRKEVAHLDNVRRFHHDRHHDRPARLATEGGATLWDHITGRRRKLADGIWVQFGVYAK
jgi:hypothetical protein